MTEPITNVRDPRVKVENRNGVVCRSGDSKCVTCGKLMPGCWDTVCFDCGDTSCYAHSAIADDCWYCVKCATKRFGERPMAVVPVVTPKQVEDRKAVGLERLLNRLFNHKVIVNCDKDPYLLRWYVIRTEAFGIFIHKFVRSDEDRALHDHPWDFLVIPIWRGYFEHSEIPWHQVAIGDDVTFEPRRIEQLPSGESVQARIDPAAPVPIRRRVRPFVGTRFRRGTYRHRVELLTKRVFTVERFPMTGYPGPGPMICGPEDVPLPSWSIFIRFKKFRDWGFWPKDGFILNSTWWKERCD